MSFYLYKGLKKPLVLFGLKNKYIYYGLGSALGGLICVAILSSLIGWIGIVIGGVIAGGGLFGAYKMQDRKGLYNKTKNNKELFIFPKKFKNLKQKGFIKQKK